MRNIRSIPNYIQSIYDWTPFNDCFKGKIRITDVDGEVERRGNFLRFEGKSPGRDVPPGQQIVFKELLKTGRWTICVFWGTSGNEVLSELLRPRETDEAAAMLVTIGMPQIEHIRCYYPDGQVIEQDCDFQGFHDFVSRWFKWANSHPYQEKP